MVNHHRSGPEAQTNPRQAWNGTTTHLHTKWCQMPNNQRWCRRKVTRLATLRTKCCRNMGTTSRKSKNKKGAILKPGSEIKMAIHQTDDTPLEGDGNLGIIAQHRRVGRSPWRDLSTGVPNTRDASAWTKDRLMQSTDLSSDRDTRLRITWAHDADIPTNAREYPPQAKPASLGCVVVIWMRDVANGCASILCIWMERLF